MCRSIGRFEVSKTAGAATYTCTTCCTTPDKWGRKDNNSLSVANSFRAGDRPEITIARQYHSERRRELADGRGGGEAGEGARGAVYDGPASGQYERVRLLGCGREIF